MKPTPSVLALAAFAVALAGAANTAAGTRNTAPGVVVATITDGDTLRLRDGRRVRLLQIDTPELGTGECYSRAARTALLRLVPVGSDVSLEADPALDPTDRYGRLLRYIRHNGVNVNLELVRRGDAAPYFYSGERGRYAGALMAAAVSARSGKRGLWASCPKTELDPTEAINTGQSGPATSGAPAITTPATLVPAPSTNRCDPNYSGGCVPPYPPDVDCADIRALGIAPVRVLGSDPHRLDADHDGWGCE